MTSSSKSLKSFYSFLGAVLCVHIMMMWIQFKDSIPTFDYDKSKTIQVRITPETLKEVLEHKKQIVQSEDSKNNTEVENAFLSDKTRSFDRETVAKNIDTFNKAAKGNSDVTQKNQIKKQSKNINLADIGVAAKQPFKTNASESIKGIETGDELSKGLSATNDYVEDMTLGDFTQLNTVEYKFYGFFHRIRQNLEQYWGRSIQEKADALFKAGRRLPASENYVTNLQVTLNAQGEIIGVKILGASGVKELDDAAIESFNQAGPFPNPPSELLVNGKATIDWGFVVKG